MKSFYKYIKPLITDKKTINFGDFKLTISTRDGGGRMYRQPSYFADLVCPIQQEIIDRFHPTVFLDIGANYGFTSLLHFSKNPSCLIVAVEPSPSLVLFLKRNLEDNKCSNFKLINSVCSDTVGKTTFSLHPFSSQDNRVIGEKNWKSVVTSSITLETLLESVGLNEFVYIKIDTQGFEEKVFRGGERFLSTNSNWLIKTEFAPKWLLSQGTNPTSFLQSLVSKYIVTELPKRTRFKGDSLSTLLQSPIRSNECSTFVDYVQSLASGDGWCDLIIFPHNIAL